MNQSRFQPDKSESRLLLGNIFPIFAYCGLVVEIQLHLAAKICLIFFGLPFQRQPS